MEAMKHNYSANYIKTVVAGFKTIMETKDYSRKAIEKTKIEKITFDTFGISVDLQIDPLQVENAYVIPPDLVKNHPLLDNLRRHFATEKDSISFLKSNKKDQIIGCVDPDSGKVSGDFSKLTNKIVLYAGLFESGQYTPEQIAGIYSHEVGHAWSYFFYIAKVFTTNLVLEAAIRAFTNTDNVKARTMIVETAAESLNSKHSDPEPILTGKQDKDVIALVILGDVQSQPNSLMYSALHDAVAYEQVADQFVSRLGLGKELGQGLGRMAERGDISGMGIITWGVINTLASISLGIYTPLILPLLLLAGDDPSKSYYDSAPKRILRIKQDAITALKDSKLNAEDTKRALETVSSLDVFATTLKERELFIVKVWRLFVSPWKTQKEIMDRQKQLEELAASPLYVHAAKFRTATLSDGTTGELIPHDELDVSMESFNSGMKLLEIAETLSGVGLESQPALEGTIGDILKSILDSIMALIDKMLSFFSSDVVNQAEVDVEKIKESSGKEFHITHDDVENSDSLTETLAIPLIATVYDPKLLPKTAIFIDKLSDLIKLTNKSLAGTANDSLDKRLEKMDSMSPEDFESEIAQVEVGLDAIVKDVPLLIQVAKELNIEHAKDEKDFYTDSPRRAAELLLMIIDSTGKYHSELAHKVNRESVVNIDWARSNKAASDAQAAIATMRIKEKDLKAKQANLKSLNKASKDLSNSDNSVQYLKRTLAVEGKLLSLSTRSTKLMVARLKGQRRVNDLVESISRDKR